MKMQGQKNVLALCSLVARDLRRDNTGRGILRISENASGVSTLKIDFQRFVELILAGWKEETC